MRNTIEPDEIVLATRKVELQFSKRGWGVLGILSALMTFGALSTDLYLPAMPLMAKDLATDIGLMEWTVSVYLMGFSLGQLFWGPIGDRFGRKWPIAFGLILFVVGSAGCALSDNVNQIISWRLVQAFGACASVVLARAMVRDLYHGDRAAQMMSRLMIIMAIVPLLGPILGGQIMHVSGWRLIFWFLVLFGGIIFLALMTLPETLSRQRRNHTPFLQVYIGYGEVLRNPRFLAFVAAGGFFFSGLFAFIAGTPFAYITYYHVSEQLYGLLFGLAVLGVMLTNFVNAKFVTRFGCHRMLFIGTIGAAISGAITMMTAYTNWGGLWGLVVPLCLFISMAGLMIANSVTGALSHYPEKAGAVSALVGLIQNGFGIVGSAAVGAFSDGTPLPLAIVIGVSGIGSLFCALVLRRFYAA